MIRGKDKKSVARALTLLEMMIAIAIMAVVFAALLPQFKNVQNNWDSKQANSEMLQNGRILMDHLSRSLSCAVCITSVSDPSEDDGFIEFQDVTGTSYRYSVNDQDYIEFGPLGDPAELAGPVTSLRFMCYELTDMSTPTVEVNLARYVEVEATFANLWAMGQERVFTASAFMAVNPDALPRVIKESDFEFDWIEGQTPNLCKISDTKYLCTYSGPDNDGWAVILLVDRINWTVSKGTPFEFDADTGTDPVTAQIDSTHYLCAYTGQDDHGKAVVLTVNLADNSVSSETTYEFDSQTGLYPDIIEVDTDNYLCVYTGPDSDGWAIILNVDESDWSIKTKSSFEFDSVNGQAPCLSPFKEADNKQLLCAYTGADNEGVAIVLTVNPAGLNITKQSEIIFDGVQGLNPYISKVDNGRCLCVYEGPDSDGYAVVLDVDMGSFNISKAEPLEFDNVQASVPVISGGDNRFICIYSGSSSDGWAVTFSIDAGDGSVSKGLPLLFDETESDTPNVAKLDSDHYLCVYDGANMDGWAAIFSIDDSIRP